MAHHAFMFAIEKVRVTFSQVSACRQQEAKMGSVFLIRRWFSLSAGDDIWTACEDPQRASIPPPALPPP